MALGLALTGFGVAHLTVGRKLLRHEDAFGLDTDRKRIVRLLFQPLLVLWSLFAGDVL